MQRAIIGCCTVTNRAFLLHFAQVPANLSPRFGRLSAAGAFIGINDARDQWVAHDIAAGEVAMRNAFGLA